MIGQQLGAYTLQSELGSGGMGNVFLADGPDGRVAIKVVHPHLLETPGFFKRFMQEAELGKRVRHENVVRTFDVDALMLDGVSHHFMVMEYVQGKNLRDLLIELGTVPESLLREIALQTTAGLCAIHKQGIVHRDLKPENILITDEHEIRIMDLGVAKLQEATMAITKEGQFAGSLLYAAPEQFQRNEEVGLAADLYSLGVLLYELATGETPVPERGRVRCHLRAPLRGAAARARAQRRALGVLQRGRRHAAVQAADRAVFIRRAPARRLARGRTLRLVG